MDKEQIERFREEFQDILYLNSLITANNTKLKLLHTWDKNGSHTKAILRNIEERKELKAKLETQLKGKTYDEWKLFSKRLSVLTNRLRNAVSTIKKSEIEINDLTF